MAAAAVAHLRFSDQVPQLQARALAGLVAVEASGLLHLRWIRRLLPQCLLPCLHLQRLCRLEVVAAGANVRSRHRQAVVVVAVGGGSEAPRQCLAGVDWRRGSAAVQLLGMLGQASTQSRRLRAHSTNPHWRISSGTWHRGHSRRLERQPTPVGEAVRLWLRR